MKKTANICIFVALVCAASSHGATVLANSVVITNSVPNNGPNVATHWAEVQVFQQGSGTNVAAGLNGGTAIASSTGWGTSPSWAIDGNTDGAFGGNSSWHDNDGQGGGAEADVFTVTFSAPFLVDSFNVHGRNDCCAERDDIFEVAFYNGATLVATQSASIGGTFSTGLTAIVPEPSVTAAGLLAFGALSLRRRRA